MNVYELEIENADFGYRLLHHVRAEDDADAIARGLAHWGRPVLSVKFRRPCKPWEVAQQRIRDTQSKPDPNDIHIQTVLAR